MGLFYNFLTVSIGSIPTHNYIPFVNTTTYLIFIKQVIVLSVSRKPRFGAPFVLPFFPSMLSIKKAFAVREAANAFLIQNEWFLDDWQIQLA